MNASPDHNLDAYLQDHLAGSVAALELLEHLGKNSADASEHRFYTRLRAEIEEDQDTLRGILQACGGVEGSVRKAVAWMAEKAGWVKLQIAGTGHHGIGVLQALEVLLLGITGKKALWEALAEVSRTRPVCQKINFAKLIQRATDQISRVEAQRLIEVRQSFPDK